MQIIQFLIDLFHQWGVSFEACASASAIVIIVMGFLAERGFVFKDFNFTLFGKFIKVSGTLATTLLVSILIGGYSQYVALGLVLLPILGGGVLTFLISAGFYDATLKKLERKPGSSYVLGTEESTSESPEAK